MDQLNLLFMSAFKQHREGIRKAVCAEVSKNPGNLAARYAVTYRGSGKQTSKPVMQCYIFAHTPFLVSLLLASLAASKISPPATKVLPEKACAPA